MIRRVALSLIIGSTLAACPWAKAKAAPVLSVDFGHDISPPTPVQPGFVGLAGGATESSRTEVIGAFSVQVEGGGFFHAGFNAGNVGASLAPLFEDYYYNNATDPAVGITVTVTGVTPNAAYDVKLWSYDEDNIFSVTPTQWGPASGSATTGEIGLVSDSSATPYPTTLDEKATTVRLRSTTNQLTFFGASTSGSGGTRLNGFQLTLVPEPSGGALAVVAGIFLPARLRKLRSRRIVA
jgi:hypothetical protein